MKTKIEVEIQDIKIEGRYYSFKYKVWVNGVFKKEDTFSDTHSRFGEEDEFMHDLKNGYAVECVLAYADKYIYN